jgi:hypothetical protein
LVVDAESAREAGKGGKLRLRNRQRKRSAQESGKVRSRRQSKKAKGKSKWALQIIGLAERHLLFYFLLLPLYFPTFPYLIRFHQLERDSRSEHSWTSASYDPDDQG